MNSRTRYGVLLIAGSSVLFALMAVVARSLTGKVSVGQLVLARFVLGILALLPLYLADRAPPQIVRPRVWALRGLFGGGAVFFYFLAIGRLGVGPATLLNYTSPLFAAVFAAFFLREALTARLVIGLAASTLGAALVVLSTADQPHVIGWEVGVVAGAGSAVLGGAAMTVVKTLRRDHSAATVFLSFNVFGLLWAMPPALADWRPLSAEVLAPLVAVGLLSVAAQMIFTYAFAYTPTAIGSATTQLVPVISWTLGVLWLAEPFHQLALIGALVAVGGVLMGTLPVRVPKLAPALEKQTDPES